MSKGLVTGDELPFLQEIRLRYDGSASVSNMC